MKRSWIKYFVIIFLIIAGILILFENQITHYLFSEKSDFSDCNTLYIDEEKDVYITYCFSSDDSFSIHFFNCEYEKYSDSTIKQFFISLLDKVTRVDNFDVKSCYVHTDSCNINSTNKFLKETTKAYFANNKINFNYYYDGFYFIKN